MGGPEGVLDVNAGTCTSSWKADSPGTEIRGRLAGRELEIGGLEVDGPGSDSVDSTVKDRGRFKAGGEIEAEDVLGLELVEIADGDGMSVIVGDNAKGGGL